MRLRRCGLLWLVCLVPLFTAPARAAEPAPVPHAGGDWPEWCGRPDRNMISDEKGLPNTFDEAGTGARGATILQNVKWCARLGAGPRNMVFGSPVVAGGRVFIGGADCQGGAQGAKALTVGALWCFRESDGKLLWKLRSPYVWGLYNRSFGICSTPTVEGDRVYLLGHLGEVLCLDANGLANGNDSPFKDENKLLVPGVKVARNEVAPDGSRIVEVTGGTSLSPEPADADIVWRFDLIRDARCWPCNALNGAILIRGDYLYVPTCSTLSNFAPVAAANRIRDWKAKNGNKPYASPSLIVLDKKTGKLLAEDDAGIFPETFHGAHSSPALGTVNGRELLFYGGGNGKCYAFDPDFTPGIGGQPGVLKMVWKFNPLEWPAEAAKKDATHVLRAETVATPVFYKNRVYVAVGNDLIHSGARTGPGRLVCIDAAGKGDITRTGKVWSYDAIRSSSSTVAIADGLLYAADAAGYVHCLDADTGKLYWKHLCAAPVWGSPLAADGKVYVPTYGKGLVVLAAGKLEKVIAEPKLSSSLAASPAVAHGTMYLASQSHLYALRAGAAAAAKDGGTAAAGTQTAPTASDRTE